MKNLVLLLALSLNAILVHADPRDYGRPVHLGRATEADFETSSSPEMLRHLYDNANFVRGSERDCDQALNEREPANAHFMEHEVHLLY